VPHRDRHRARIADLARVRGHGHGRRVQRELETEPVVDRSAVRGDGERLAVLARSEPVERVRSDCLQPAGPGKRDRKHEREDGGEQADSPVRDPQRHAQRRRAFSSR
jgi:hypothetical protein